MPERTPVAFQWNGKLLLGYLESVCGAGAQVYHLMVDRYYWGRLRQNANKEWVLDTHQKGLDCYATEFSYWVTNPITLIFHSEYSFFVPYPYQNL